MYVLKTKTCKWDRKLGYLHLNYDKGVDVLWDTIDVATHFGFITSPAQGSFHVVDVDTGEIMKDSEGKEIKIRGKKEVVRYFEQNPDQWRRLYDLVYDKLKQKEDPHIKAFEEMLGINVYESLGVSEATNLEEV
jgi:hypothetical protein